MRFRDFLLAEEKNDTAVMTFGRFQPITSAHETLIKQVGSLAKEKGAHPFVFTSRKSGDKKNPLDFNMKSDMLRKHYGVNVPDSEEITNPFQAAKHLGDAGYKNVHLVLGGDRVKDIGGMIKKYMGHEDPEKRINISNLTLHSAGERSANPVSGTAVRAAARSGNVKEFQRMIAPSLGKESTETIYRVLRGEQQLGESLDKPFATTYTSKTISGRKRHYYDFEVPPRKPESKIDKLSDPKKGTIEFLPAVDASGNPTKKGHVELSFDIDGDMHTTGGGRAGGVFSTVKTAVKDFMKNNPDTKVLKANIMAGDQYKRDLDDNVVKDKDGNPVFSGRAKLYKRLSKHFGDEYGFDVDVDMDGGYFKATRKTDSKLAEEKTNGKPNRTGPRTGLGSTKLVGVRDPKTGKIKIKHVFANEPLKEAKRIPKTKEGQDPDTHSDLYTDEDPKGTIHGLGFTNASRARESVKKIKNSGRKHAHKIQAAIAMSQRAKVASQRAKDPKKKKSLAAAHKVYQSFIDRNKKSD